VEEFYSRVCDVQTRFMVIVVAGAEPM
jgi:hypothetical protein